MEQPLIRKARDQKDGLAFADAKAYAEASGGRLARNAEFDRFFGSSPAGQPLTLTHNAWTETVLAYPKPKAPFRDSVEWTDYRSQMRYIIDTREFRGQKRAAILFEGCELVPDGENMLIIPSVPPRLIERFPQECGFYSYLPDCGIPIDDGGDRRPSLPGTRHLTRDNNGEWVGPLVRPYSRIRTPDDFDQEIYAHFSLSTRLGVFLADKS